MNEKEKSMLQATEYAEITQTKLIDQYSKLKFMSLGIIFLCTLLITLSLFLNFNFIKSSRIFKIISLFILVSPLLGTIITSLSSFLSFNKINFDLSMSKQLLDNNDVILFLSKRLKILNEDILSINKSIKKVKSVLRTSLICLISYFGVLLCWLVVITFYFT